jgi:5-methylcytosine-specific restriction endonuclease McrA
MRARVLAEEPNCRSCGAKATVVDHIVPRFLGGGHNRENLQPLCANCHRLKTHREGELGKKLKRARGGKVRGLRGNTEVAPAGARPSPVSQSGGVG